MQGKMDLVMLADLEEAGTSGTTSEHRRVCSMPLDDEVRVRHLVEAEQGSVLRGGSEPR
jgi:hypothetical protein